MQDINNISGQLYQLWKICIDLLKSFAPDILAPLKGEQQQKIRERLGESIFRNTIKTSDLTRSDEELVAGKTHESIAEQMRGKNYYEHLEEQNVEDTSLKQNPDEHPIVFEEVFVKQNHRSAAAVSAAAGTNSAAAVVGGVAANPGNSANNNKTHQVNLFVLSHGFQGSSYDMRQLKNNLSLVF